MYIYTYICTYVKLLDSLYVLRCCCKTIVQMRFNFNQKLSIVLQHSHKHSLNSLHFSSTYMHICLEVMLQNYRRNLNHKLSSAIVYAIVLQHSHKRNNSLSLSLLLDSLLYLVSLCYCAPSTQSILPLRAPPPQFYPQ